MPTRENTIAHPWREQEITLHAQHTYANAYTDVAVWADFTHENGTVLRRPAFGTAATPARLRFASPLDSGVWTWRTAADIDDSGLVDQAGQITRERPAPPAGESLYRHGFWRMSPAARSLRMPTGAPLCWRGDTAGGRPWRATHDECRVHGRDRQAKGFNAALLMSIQPDMDARWARASAAPTRALMWALRICPAATSTNSTPPTSNILTNWFRSRFRARNRAGLSAGLFWFWSERAARGGAGAAAGGVCPPTAAIWWRVTGRCPAVYLVGGDGSGREPQVAAGGEEVEKWDAYRQPTGIHYRPHIVANASQEAEAA